MKILLVYTHRSIMWESGAKTKVDQIAELFSRENEVVFLLPKPRKGDAFPLRREKVYYFREWFLMGKTLAYFSDTNINLLYHIRKIVRKERIDIICISYPWGVPAASIICPGVPVIYDSHDFVVESVKIIFSRYPVIIKQLLQFYLSFIERLAVKRASHIITISELDREKLINYYRASGQRITTIPIWVKSKKLLSSLEEKRSNITVVFHGTYNHVPNREAFNLVFNYLAPEVAKHNPDIRFVLAGNALPAFERDNMKSLGFLEDLSPFLREADIAIVPVCQGTGMRVKIFDYMAAGLPIITTRKGIEGIRAEDGESAIILDGVNEEFVEAILKLAGDKKERERLGANAKELAAREYNQDSIYTKFGAMLECLKENNKLK